MVHPGRRHQAHIEGPRALAQEDCEVQAFCSHGIVAAQLREVLPFGSQRQACFLISFHGNRRIPIFPAGELDFRTRQIRELAFVPLLPSDEHFPEFLEFSTNESHRARLWRPSEVTFVCSGQRELYDHVEACFMLFRYIRQVSRFVHTDG